jgi:uncharacterized membrane protein YtjA (UPF0391 family)
MPEPRLSGQARTLWRRWRNAASFAAFIGNRRMHTIGYEPDEDPMLYWALVFFIVAIVAGALGFGGLAATAGSIAHILFFLFLVLFIVTLIAGLMGRRAGPPL